MNSPLLTRRDFLFWSGALGASAALPLAWMEAEPVHLGFVGLGTRGRKALAACRELSGAKVVALCDRRADALDSALAGPGSAAGFVTREANRLFAEPSVDAVVLSASTDAQAGLAAAACAAGKDVFLLRPLPFEPDAWKAVAEKAARCRRQVQVARDTAFALEPGAAGGLIASSGESLVGAEVEAWFQTPERPEGGALLSELLDEIDFAQTMLGGRVVRSSTLGGPGVLPGRWIDQRVQVELSDERGVRRWLGVHLVATRGEASPKASGVFVRGDRGGARLAGSPLSPGDPRDLALFLDAVRRREAGAGLSLSRALELWRIG